MIDRFPTWGAVPTRPRCACCTQVIVVDLHVPDDLWNAVMRDPNAGYVCVNCFASRADEKLIDWAPYITLIPLSLVEQMKVQVQAKHEQGSFPRVNEWRFTDRPIHDCEGPLY